MNLFDILGPVMVGPSSSHKAGAVRLGRIARRLLGEGTPCRADITLFGSFAATGCGHGTDRALIAGLLGYKPDDERIAEAALTIRKIRTPVVPRRARSPKGSRQSLPT